MALAPISAESVSFLIQNMMFLSLYVPADRLGARSWRGDEPAWSAAADATRSGFRKGRFVVRQRGRAGKGARDAGHKTGRTPCGLRSEGRRGGKEGVSPCRYRWSP